MSILKRGIVTMPLLTCRTFTQYSHTSNLHHPFELLPYPSLSYADHLSWILKGSMSTSSLNYETTHYLQNTSVPKPTQDGPLVTTAVRGGTQYHSTRSRDSEGHWLQLKP